MMEVRNFEWKMIMALTCRGDSERWERCGEGRQGRNPQSCSAHSPSGQTQCVGCEGSFKKNNSVGIALPEGQNLFCPLFLQCIFAEFSKKRRDRTISFSCQFIWSVWSDDGGEERGNVTKASSPKSHFQDPLCLIDFAIERLSVKLYVAKCTCLICSMQSRCCWSSSEAQVWKVSIDNFKSAGYDIITIQQIGWWLIQNENLRNENLDLDRTITESELPTMPAPNTVTNTKCKYKMKVYEIQFLTWIEQWRRVDFQRCQLHQEPSWQQSWPEQTEANN